MELPQIARKVGTIDDARIVYIEDYVLQYLESCRKRDMPEDVTIIFYGNKYTALQGEIYVIYGAYLSNENSGDKLSATDRTDREGKEVVGCLNMDIWRQQTDGYSGIVVGNGIGGQLVNGYYIFYDADEQMKSYISKCYRKDSKTEIQAELVALSTETGKREVSPYIYIRMAVICIFIILCAIAVTTINSYNKIYDFMQTAVQTGELIDE